MDYCASDVYALERLLPRMLPEIDLPRALQRGRYMRAAAVMEYAGVPIDVDTLNELRAHWDDIKEQLIADVDRDYGVFDGTTFKTTLFEEYLTRQWHPVAAAAIGSPRARSRHVQGNGPRLPDHQHHCGS